MLINGRQRIRRRHHRGLVGVEANPFDTDDEAMDALLKEAITEFEQCRIQLNRITERQHGRQHRSIETADTAQTLTEVTTKTTTESTSDDTTIPSPSGMDTERTAP